MPSRGYCTTTVPFIPGWMWQSYSKVPAVVKVRDIDMLALAPVIGSGAPAGDAGPGAVFYWTTTVPRIPGWIWQL